MATRRLKTAAGASADRKRLARKLEDAELDEDAYDELRPFLTEGFVLATARTTDAKLPLGRTKIGGSPDLPRDASWPYNKDLAPLSFIAQVQLADVPSAQGRERLPADGLLSFFYSLEGSDVHVGCILYTPKTEKLARTKPPPLTRTNPFGPMALAVEPCATTLSPSKLFAAYEASWFTDYDPGGEIQELFQINETPQHVLLGFATRISSSELGKSPKKGWVHLLQIDSDEAAALTLGDMGSISYWVPSADLERRDFRRARVLFECA